MITTRVEFTRRHVSVEPLDSRVTASLTAPNKLQIVPFSNREDVLRMQREKTISLRFIQEETTGCQFLRNCDHLQ